VVPVTSEREPRTSSGTPSAARGSGILASVPAFGPSHLVMLAVFAVGLWPAYRLGVARRGHGAHDPVTRALAGLVAALGVGLAAYDVLARFDVGVSLPLHLSDLAWITAALALWTRSRLLVALTWFWGVLTLQAVLTPSLGEDFPDPRYLAFWALHLLSLWTPVLLVLGARVTPRWQEYRLAFVVTLAWAVVVYGFNRLAGTNYGYLVRKPAGGSALDLFGPWPVYLVVAAVVLAGLWAVMTWPWVRSGSTDRLTPGRP